MKVRYLLLVLITLQQSVHSITAASASDVVITLNVTGGVPLNNDDQTGFMDEVAIEVFQRIGIKLQTIRLPAERGLKNSNSGIIDGEMGRIKGLDKIYLNLVRVPEKIMDWEFVTFSYHEPISDQSWSGLSGKSVAYINGWKILETNVPEDAEITRTTTADGLFNLLRNKRTDYVIYELWGGLQLIQQKAMLNVNVCRTALIIKELFIYLHTKHKALVPKLAVALKEMKQDGSYQRLVDKHLTPLENASK